MNDAMFTHLVPCKTIVIQLHNICPKKKISLNAK